MCVLGRKQLTQVQVKHAWFRWTKCSFVRKTGHKIPANDRTWEEPVGEEGSHKVLLQEVDESVGGGVVRADGRVVLQLRLDLLGQLLPQFNAVGRKQEVSGASSPDTPQGGWRPPRVGGGHSPPLVVAVDVPDDPLHKDLVLVHGWKPKTT